MRVRFIAAIAIGLAGMLALPFHCAAQAVSGTLAGTVLDPSGAAIARAEIAITNSKTGVEVRSVSNDLGYYNVPNLNSGMYTLVVSAQGFRRYEQTSLEINIGTVTRVDVVLPVGDLKQEVVTVTADAAQIHVEPALGGSLTSQSLMALPTFSRNPLAMAKLQAGVMESPGQQGVPSAGTSANFSFTVNGQRTMLNRALLDGVDDYEGVGGGVPVVPIVDALQEFSVNTSNYDVEFGRTAGAVSLMTTRSGTNSLHGSLYEYNRVNDLFARNSFTEPVGPGHFVFNQFGGTVGGPIVRNKLFAFANVQAVRVRSGGNTRITLPIAAFRQGNFSQLSTHPIYDPLTGGAGGVGRTAFPNNVIPTTRISTPAANLMALMPQPNLTGTDQNFIAPNMSPVDEAFGTIRVDYTFNDSNRMFVRYTRRHGDSTSTVPALGKTVNPGSNVGMGRNSSLMADWTHLFSSTFILDTRFGWLQTLSSSLPVDLTSKTSTEIGIPGLNDACTDCGGLAGMRVGGPVGNFDIGNTDHSRTIDNYGGYDFQALATWNRGSHSIKFGADIDPTWRDRLDTGSQGNFGCQDSSLCNTNGFSQNLTGTPDVTNSGLGVASFLLGVSSQFQRVIYANRLPLAKQNLLASFIQDTWQVTPKLTLILGLRWDYIGYPTSPTPGGIANFNFSNAYTIISNYGDSSATANVDNNYHDFAPRIGIAYRISKDTIVRTGFARSFSLGYYGANFGAITNDWPNATRQRIVQSVDPYTPISVTFASGPPTFVSGFDILKAANNPGQYPTPVDSAGFGTDRHNPTHSIDQWNFTVQRSFKDFSLSAGYVGNAGRHIFFRTDWNAAVPGPGSLITRRRYGALGYSVVEYNQTNKSSTGYHGLQLQAEKRYAKNFMLTTAVTWSKSYDFGIQTDMFPFNDKLDRAPQDADRAVNVSVGHVWDLPFGPGQRFLTSSGAARFLTAGWQFSGISRWMSGTPFSPTLGNSASLNSDCCTLRPNRNGSGTVKKPSRTQWFDPSAFSVPALYVFGNSGRNILRGPAFSSFDLALTKSVNFTEQKRLELSWQVFNALNSTNLSNPVSAVDSSTAGQIQGISAPMRRQQIGLHFFF